MKKYINCLLIIFVCIFVNCMINIVYAIDKDNYNNLNKYEKILYEGFINHKDDLKKGEYPIIYQNELNEVFADEDMFVGINLNNYLKNALEAFKKDNPDIEIKGYNKLKIWGYCDDELCMVFVGPSENITDEDEFIKKIDDDVEYIGNDKILELNKFFYLQLNDFEKAVYSQLFLNIDKLKSGELSFSISGNTSNSNTLKNAVSVAVEAFKRDNPEIFYIYNYSYSYNEKKVVIDIKSLFTTQEEADKAIQQVEKKKDSIINQLKGSDISKLWQIHDYLANEKKQSEDLNKNIPINTLYSAIFGKSNSEGYSMAFKYLLNSIGIKCEIMDGTYKKNNWKWNAVYINNNWYICDIGCDASVIWEGEAVSWYSMNGLNECLLDHNIDTSLFEYPQIIRYSQKQKNNYGYKNEGDIIYSHIILDSGEEGIYIVGIENNGQESVKIPSKINGEKVIAIRYDAFSYLTNLKKVELSENLKTIGSTAFIGCKNLNSINIPKSVTKIVENSFKGCDNICLLVYNNSYGLNYARENKNKYSIIDKKQNLGDVNEDNKVTLADCTKILAHVKKTKLLTEEEQKRADVNKDGKVTLADYTKVLAHVKKTKLLE